MKTLRSSISSGAILSSVLLSRVGHDQPADEFFTQQKRNKDIKHVHLMHIDGVRPDIFKKMLKAGQLPHFQFLLKRG